MASKGRVPHRAVLWAALVLGTLGTGCTNLQMRYIPPDSPIPRELNMVTMPTHVIQPSDTLAIEGGRLVQKGPYRISPLDELRIYVTKTLPDEPIDFVYIVEPEGTVRLGGSYGTVRVAGLTLEEAERAIRKHLETTILEPDKERIVAVALEQGRGLEDITGEYTVRPDGMVILGGYGGVFVAGLTPPEAKTRIDEHLGEFLDQPNVTLDAPVYNGVYYLIVDQLAGGEVVYKNPLVGNETVLDVLTANLSGLPPGQSKHRIWVARPAPPGLVHCDQMLPVDWKAITQRGNVTTNYQVLPGDRIYVKSDILTASLYYMNLAFAPFDRAFSFATNGLFTVDFFRSSISSPAGIFQGGFGGSGFFGFPGFFQ